MGKILAILFLITFLLFAFLIMRGLLLKGILHFKLLKKIYPKSLENVKSYFQLLLITNSFKLNFDILLWFWVPIYYTKIPIEELTEDTKELHFKLKQNNKQLVIILLCFVGFFIIFWNVSMIFGT